MPKVGKPLIQVVIVQEIHTHWEKSARGGPKAFLRNQVPEAVKLEDIEVDPGSLLYVTQHVYYSSRNNFAEPTRTVTAPPTMVVPQFDGVFLDFDNGALAASYQYNRGHGAPERSAWKTKAFSLSEGEWGRIRYNGRHSDMDGYWGYDKWVWNVGLFSSISPSAFLETEPVKVASYMGLLK